MKYINDDTAPKATFSLATLWKRMKLTQGLQALDDRLLEDIGIHRGEISGIASRAYPMASFKEIVSGMMDKMIEIRMNHQAAWELYQLDDRQLADMGVYRSDIPSISKGHYPERHTDASPLIAYGTDSSKITPAINDDQQRAA